jgi:hypothetical protein
MTHYQSSHRDHHSYYDKETIITKKVSLAIENLKRSRYFYANLLYVIYSTGMVIIDWGDFTVETDNTLYIFFGFCHCFNAAMYLWMWAEDRPILSFFVLPDWLNVIGACLYLYTAFLYEGEYKSDDYYAPRTGEFATVRWLELIASIIEVFAAVGWVMQWHWECRKYEIAGRGFTLDDPDIWANVTIMVGALYYLYYNLSLFQAQNFGNYDTNYVYYEADYWYWANSLIYLLGCSFRDCGFFFFLPTAGVWPKFNASMLADCGLDGDGDEQGSEETQPMNGGGGGGSGSSGSSSGAGRLGGGGGEDKMGYGNSYTEKVPESTADELLLYGTFQNK